MAEGKSMWCISSTKLLIREYERHEFLHNSKHLYYKNRNKRLEAYKHIVDALRKINANCTIEDVKKKLNGLRSQYLAEKMKVINSIKSGAVGDNVYKPTVYWFPLLKFLEKATNADESQNNIKTEISNQEQASTSYEENIMPEMSHLIPVIQANKRTYERSSKRKKRNVTRDDLLLQSSNTMAEISKISEEKRQENESLDTFGKFIVSELRSIQSVGNDLLLRRTKRKIQQVLLNTWDLIDMQSPADTPLSVASREDTLLSAASSSDWSTAADLPDPPEVFICDVHE